MQMSMLPLKETLHSLRQERGRRTQRTPSCKVSTFRRGGPLNPILYSLPVPVADCYSAGYNASLLRYLLYAFHSAWQHCLSDCPSLLHKGRILKSEWQMSSLVLSSVLPLSMVFVCTVPSGEAATADPLK